VETVKQYIKDNIGTPMGHVRNLKTRLSTVFSYECTVEEAVNKVKDAYIEIEGSSPDLTILSRKELSDGVLERLVKGEHTLAILKWVCNNNPMSLREGKELIEDIRKNKDIVKEQDKNQAKERLFIAGVELAAVVREGKDPTKALAVFDKCLSEYEKI